jgi:hypothetical protein
MDFKDFEISIYKADFFKRPVGTSCDRKVFFVATAAFKSWLNGDYP